MEKESRVFALLIDADNVSPKYISAIIEEMTTKYGNLSYRRIYGDFTETRKKPGRMFYVTIPLLRFSSMKTLLVKIRLIQP